METLHYTRQASNPTRAAIRRLIAIRRFGHTTGSYIGSCCCCHIAWGDCPRTSDRDIWEHLETGAPYQGWYKGRAFYLDSREHRAWKTSEKKEG